MIKEVKILLEEDTHKSKNGSVFENLIRTVLEKDRYSIIQNVHDAGLEIDLLAQHKVRNEILYVECKAKEKPKSTEIKNFIYSVDYGVADKQADFGYFIHTQELDRQAAVLKISIETKKKNVSFIGPGLLIEILEDSNKIMPFRDTTISEMIISKLILAVSPEGFHYILILQQGSVPQYFTTLNAKNNKPVKVNVQEFYQNGIKELNDLKIFEINDRESPTIPKLEFNERDIILQIRESENWYEHSPASFQHFIGRLSIRRNLKGFLEKVRTGRTKNRIFFLDGKSGWGKSSLLAELKGSSQKLKYWHRRIFVSAIDTRSASTANFIGLAFKQLIDDAIASGFIERNIFIEQIVISSPHDILADDTIRALFKELKRTKKLLVLIFDQFEDQFRKESLFDAFYKFCLDIDAYKENIVIGFSWKSEINIPIGNPAHPKFIHLRDYAYQITIPEFTQNDVKQIIIQLENSINTNLGIELHNRIIQSSQGFPWLAKKLCIHTLNQFNKSKTIDDIIEEELNYKELFESDLLGLSGDETKALEYIAKRAYDGNPFQISEYDILDQEVVNSLIHNRLVIRTGGTYNIYWDIFRDYIVNKDIPVIGESYLLRNSGKACLDCFLTFKIGETLSIKELCNYYPNAISENSMQNIVLELRSIGLVKKTIGKDEYIVTPKVSEISEVFFKNYITNKLSNYTPYLELLKLNKQLLTVDDIIDVLKSIFKTEKFEDSTWSIYAKYLIIWFKMSNLSVASKIAEVLKGRGKSGKFSFEDKYGEVPRYSPIVCIESFEKFKSGSQIPKSKLRDLMLMGLVSDEEEVIYTGSNIQDYLASESKSFTLILRSYNLLINNPNLKSGELIDEIGSDLSDALSVGTKKQIASIIYSWSSFIRKIETSGSVDFKNKLGNYYLSFGPNKVIDTIIDFDNGKILSDPNFKKKINNLIFLGLIKDNGTSLELTNIGLKILNSSESEFELAQLISKNKHLNKFKDFYVRVKDGSIEKTQKLDFAKTFFVDYSQSSIKTKLSLYTAWMKFEKEFMT